MPTSAATTELAIANRIGSRVARRANGDGAGRAGVVVNSPDKAEGGKVRTALCASFACAG
ncbi:MAG: hypothetical protein ACO3K3_00980 [Schleiferiaceae bacterium]